MQLKIANLICLIFYRGSKYIELPYTVKGMDVSFSGILSYIEVGLYNNLSEDIIIFTMFIEFESSDISWIGIKTKSIFFTPEYYTLGHHTLRVVYRPF